MLSVAIIGSGPTVRRRDWVENISHVDAKRAAQRRGSQLGSIGLRRLSWWKWKVRRRSCHRSYWTRPIAFARDAVRNAFRHARARRIEVEIRYGRRELQVRIRDDGSGIDPSVLGHEGRAGHWGLPGMRERAKRIGGQIDFWSKLGAGTEVELRISALHRLPGVCWPKLPSIS